MKFSRKASQLDFENALKRWEKVLHKDVRDEVMKRKDKYRGVACYRNKACCGVEEAKRVVGQYIKFLEALNDFRDGKEIYVEY